MHKAEDLLAEAFNNKKRMVYNSASTYAGDKFCKKRRIDVYHIESGYFECFCHLRKEVRFFKISRGKSLRIMKRSYTIPTDYQSSFKKE